VAKELRTGWQEYRLLLALALALLFGASCAVGRQVVFDDPRPGVHVVYAAETPSVLLDQLLVVSRPAVNLDVEAMASPDEARAKVEARTADLGLLLPAGLDAALQAGERPTITVVRPPKPTPASATVETLLQPAMQAVAGQAGAGQVVEETVGPAQGPAALLERLGIALGFAGLSFVVVLVFTGVSFVPVLLFEQVGSGTLLPVLLVARPVAVVLAKAVVSLGTMAGMGLLVALLDGLAPADAGLFLGASALLAVFMVGVGLLLGLVVPRVAYEGGGALLPLVLLAAPATLGGMVATGGWLAVALDLFPSSAAARLIEDSLVGTDLYGALPLSLAVLGVWAVAPYLLLLVLLDRREW
jgi:hypothetical protein